MNVDLRSYLNKLREKGELLEIGEEINLRYEMTAIFREVSGEQGGPAILFKNIHSHPQKSVAGNLLASRRKMALALGCDVDELRDTYLKKRFNSFDPVLWEGPAPVQENVIDRKPDLLSLIPAPLFHQGDSGHYLTAGALISRDHLTGEQNIGIHRMQLLDKNLMTVFLSNPPLSEYHREAEREGRSLPVAVALGLHPAEMMAAAVPLKKGMKSKMHLAGGLAGRPLPLVKAKTVDILVPALAEIVLEGELLPNVRKPDGPFGESSGYYFHAESPVIEVKTVTFRNEPILSLIPPWGIDTETIISTFSGAELWQELSRLIPGVLDVAFLPGALTFQGVVKVAETLSMQEIRRLIHLALNLDQRLKHVIIVDEDVDIYNPREVLWALATRFQGSRDLVSLEGMKGYVIDPSTENGEGTKMGFDATARPEGPYSDRFRKVALPQEALLKAQAIIEKARHHH
ncbi:MAG TPA: UbiD family decarboxylase [Firmicutes bacterium]|nr:UbiD family decarboxylase [Bacillota bacterium]